MGPALVRGCEYSTIFRLMRDVASSPLTADFEGRAYSASVCAMIPCVSGFGVGDWGWKREEEDEDERKQALELPLSSLFTVARAPDGCLIRRACWLPPRSFTNTLLAGAPRIRLYGSRSRERM